jgi:hypothetical protein
LFATGLIFNKQDMVAGAIGFNRNIEDSGCRFSLARCASWGTVLTVALGFVCF